MALFTGATSLSNLIVPDIFLAYMQRISSQTNRLANSNATTQDPVVESQLLAPGMFYTTPQLNDLSGDVQSWRDTADIKVNSLSSGLNIGVKLYQDQAFGNTDFGTLVTGAPAADQIASRFTQYWNRVDERLMIAVIENAFKDANLATAKSYGIGSETDLSAAGFIAAMARMGDVATPNLAAIFVNSAAYQNMKKLNLLDTNAYQSQAGSDIQTYQGIPIVLDDSIPVSSTGVTSAYIAANGSICNCTANPANAVETYRDPTGNGGQDAIINRRVKCIQIMGTTFLDAAKAADYSLANLETANAATTGGTQYWGIGTNDPRNIGIVKYNFKIDTSLIVTGINTGASDNGAAPSSLAETLNDTSTAPTSTSSTTNG